MSTIERDPRTHFENLFKSMGLGPSINDLYYGSIDENLPHAYAIGDENYDNRAWFVELKAGAHIVKICLGMYTWQAEYNIHTIIRPFLGFILIDRVLTSS